MRRFVLPTGEILMKRRKKIIRKAGFRRSLNTLTREDFEALIAIKSITDSGSNAEVRKKNGHLACMK